MKLTIKEEIQLFQQALNDLFVLLFKAIKIFPKNILQCHMIFMFMQVLTKRNKYSKVFAQNLQEFIYLLSKILDN